MFKNLRIRTRLMIIVGVLTIALMANIIIAFIGFSSTSKRIEEVYYGGINEISLLSNIKENFVLSTKDLEFTIRNGLISWNDAQEEIRKRISNIEIAWDTFQSYLKYTENNTDLGRALTIVQQKMKEIFNVIGKVQDGIKKQGKEQLTAVISNEVNPWYSEFVKDANQLIKAFEEDSAEDYKNANATISWIETLMIITLILSLFFAIAVSILIVAGITKPLNKCISIVQDLAAGDDSKDIPIDSHDEIGLLLESMQAMTLSSRKMTDSLARLSEGDLNFTFEPRSNKDTLGISILSLMNSTQTMAETLSILADGDLTVTFSPRSSKDSLGQAIAALTSSLKKIIGDIQTEVSALTTSSQEIVASVSQVSTGASETAAAVNETTTTVEELKQTAHLSADKSNEVLASAEETLQIVKSSEKSLQATLEDMNHINEKMQVISEGIVKLSEHSNAIGDIIDSVNDLAEQSNLLAVNAAIEAAKAGEQGKSFGVVAQEIRSLAEQSKSATIQVRSILNDIQNSTSAAVLATEQGSKAVEKGMTQSSQTRESMHVLSTSIARVAQSANQISLSSKQQLIGVDQVTIAMNNISEATTQHVGHMKQIETAVIALNGVGQSLKEITDHYLLENQEKFSKNITQAKKGMHVFPESKHKQMALHS